MGITDESTKSFTPILDETGKPIKLTEKEVLLSRGARAESLVDPFKVGFDKEAGKASGKLKLELDEQIIKANESNRTIARGQALLNEGLFSGPVANIKKEFNKYLKETGISLFGEEVANTRNICCCYGKRCY